MPKGYDEMKMPFWLTMKDLLKVFPQYSSLASIRSACRRGTFPIPTFKVGNKRYADKEVVAEYFKQQRREGLAAVKATSKQGKSS